MESGKSSLFYREPWYTKALARNLDEQQYPDWSHLTARRKRHIACDEFFMLRIKTHRTLIPLLLLSDRDSLRWIPVRIRKRKYPEWSYLTYERVLFFEHFPEKENSFCREPWYTKALTWNADEQKHPDGSRMTIPEALKNQCFRDRPLYINTSTCPNTNYFVNCDLLSIIFWIRFC